MAKTAEFHTLLRNYRGIMGKDAVAGYTATLESGDTVTFYCFNAKNKG